MTLLLCAVKPYYPTMVVGYVRSPISQDPKPYVPNPSPNAEWSIPARDDVGLVLRATRLQVLPREARDLCGKCGKGRGEDL